MVYSLHNFQVGTHIDAKFISSPYSFELYVQQNTIISVAQFQ